MEGITIDSNNVDEIISAMAKKLQDQDNNDCKITEEYAKRICGLSDEVLDFLKANGMIKTITN